MAAAAVAVDPLLEVRAVPTTIGLGTSVQRFINSIPITSMDDFALMHEDEAKSIIYAYNKSVTRAQNVGFLITKKLQGFLYWYHDKLRRQEPIIAADFTSAAMVTAIQSQRVENSAKDAEVEMTVGTVNINLGWWQWKERFQSKLDNKL